MEGLRIGVGKSLFQPSLVGKEPIGIHDTTFLGNIECDMDIRKATMPTGCCLGGATMVAGVGESMTKELTDKETPTMKKHIKGCNGSQVSSGSVK